MPFIGIAAKFIGLHLWTNFIRKDGVGYIWALVEGRRHQGPQGYSYLGSMPETRSSAMPSLR